jgi:hypothetical protein
VVRLTFQPARCGYTLRVTSKTLYSHEYITSKHTQKISSNMHNYYIQNSEIPNEGPSSVRLFLALLIYIPPLKRF